MLGKYGSGTRILTRQRSDGIGAGRPAPKQRESLPGLETTISVESGSYGARPCLCGS